ncbi:GntR family transcriptional regulator [Streptacidiphilus sp. P02-A3a]|uniref:GntR family transcriptional regulator n=1 Tax=Streptacidiphilus sp. P02-A3a TaxID=2704468 RepID=UPI0015F7B724|nr:GntR family transcriptional regulator [Streptacidiphilus sp. P02-A3a]QMU71649.1 GntR family transcriptional regulator [Streptacidiphilus sp. P02-A3a]
MPLPELSSQSLADQAYRALRAAIVKGELPWGEKITERGLALSLGVSATPVREALRRLEQEQLVERTSLRSLRVVTVSPQERVESAAMEAALEGVAARFAAGKASDRQLDEMGRLLDVADAAADTLRSDHDAGRPLDPVTVERAFDAIRGFHAAVEAAADNAQLLRTLEQVRAFSRSERLRITSAQLTAGGTPGQLQRYAQHRHILDALRAREAETAEQLARAHAAAAVDEFVGWDA